MPSAAYPQHPALRFCRVIKTRTRIEPKEAGSVSLYTASKSQVGKTMRYRFSSAFDFFAKKQTVFDSGTEGFLPELRFRLSMIPFFTPQFPVL
jgi:hypothetical protein